LAKKPRLSLSSEVKERMGVQLERSREGGGINEEHGAQFQCQLMSSKVIHGIELCSFESSWRKKKGNTYCNKERG
jgi:hypothetical protein